MPELALIPEITMLQDAQGRYVPIRKIKPLDMQRNDLVNDIIKKALSLRSEMQRFKEEANKEIKAHIDLAYEQYNTTVGGQKGNLQLTSFNGEYKLLIAVSDSLHFDERIHVAKSLIDKCINRWTAESSDNIKLLIDSAFQVDKEGNISVAKVLGLLRVNIKETEWLEAMQALSDSIQIQSSKSYMRIYKRNKEGKYTQISMDLSSI